VQSSRKSLQQSSSDIRRKTSTNRSTVSGTGADWYDNQCVFSGHNSDTNGYTGTGDESSSNTIAFRPRQDQPGAAISHYFGSAHQEGLHMANCDGSIHFIDYSVSGRVWYALGGRDDEEKPPESDD